MKNIILILCLLVIFITDEAKCSSYKQYKDEFLILCVNDQCDKVRRLHLPMGKNSNPSELPVESDTIPIIHKILKYFNFEKMQLHGIYEIHMKLENGETICNPTYLPLSSPKYKDPFSSFVSFQTGCVYLVRKLREGPSENEIDIISKKILDNYPKYENLLTVEKIMFDKNVAAHYFTVDDGVTVYTEHCLGLLLQNIVDTDYFRIKKIAWENECKTKWEPYCSYVFQMRQMEEKYFERYIKLGNENEFSDPELINLEGETVTFEHEMIYTFRKKTPHKKKLMRKDYFISLGSKSDLQVIPKDERFYVKSCYRNIWNLIGLSHRKNICKITDSKGTKSSISEAQLKSYLGLSKQKISRIDL